MRILIDISHPAHVHLFRHAIRIWQQKGHQITITARDKDITIHLLSQYGFDYQIASVAKNGVLGLMVGLLEHDWGVYKVAKACQCDLMLGTSVAITHVSKLLPARSVFFNEDDRHSDRITTLISYPFADYVVTPQVLPDQLGKKHVQHNSLHELAYLHPDRFTPNRAVLSDLSLSENEPFSVLRFVSLQASHDIGQKGLSLETKRQLIRLLSARGRVIITSESELPSEFEAYRIPIAPDKMHDLMAHASVFVSDSQSMTIEAAVLGIPAIRCNTFVGRTPVIEELEQSYQLTFGFLPQDENQMLECVEGIVSNPHAKQIWQERRQKMLQDKHDLTAWTVDFVEGLGK
jgi:predicted glycosyltransferase